MKIEKGKLYYCYQLESFIKAIEYYDDKVGIYTDKIAVHCPTKEDWDYVNNVISDHWGFANKYPYRLLNDYDHRYDISDVTNNSYHIITIDEFKTFYPENVQEGKKETLNKLNYELDFDFITQMAERMQTNKGKYEPYNWKKPIEIEGLKQAIFRHVIEIMKGNYEDDGRLMGHLEALACNAMMLNYQLKK